MVFSTFTGKNSLKMKVEFFVELDTLVTSWKEGVYHIVELYLQQLCPPPLPRPLIRHQRDKTKCPLYRAVCFNYWGKVMCIKLDVFKLYMWKRENCCVHLCMAKSLCNNSQQHATTLQQHATGCANVLQNKAAKIILDRPLYSSATHALATLKWVPLEKRRFQRRCIYVYKCLNGLVEHDMNFIRQQEQHDYNTRTKLNLRLPSVKRNWGK